MTIETFLKYVSQLTGTDVKGAAEIDHNGLSEILSDETRIIDFSQFNELLLLVHKDRVEKPFFEHFFGARCAIGHIAAGVAQFQKTALLLYGNFVYGYRKLSRVKSTDEFSRTVSDATKDANTELEYFHQRQRKLLEVDRIGKNETPYVGYLSAGEIRADFLRCKLMGEAAREAGAEPTWEEYREQLRVMANERELGVLEARTRSSREHRCKLSVQESRH